MTTYNITPSAQGDDDLWTNVGGASKLASVQDDVDANYIHEDNAGGRQGFYMTDLPPHVIALAQVDIFWRAKYATAVGQVGSALDLSGVEGVQQYSGNVTTSWADYTQTDFRLNGGVLPTIADVNHATFQVLVINVTGGGNDIWCTKYYCPCQVTLSSGGLVALVFEFLGPVLGAGLHLGHMPRLINAFNRAQGKCIIHAHEAADLLRDIQAETYRRYAFLAV